MPKTYTAVVGPSSAGKSTYARRVCRRGCELIDSDEVWFDLAKRHNWDMRKVDAELYPEMLRRARRSPCPRVMLVDLDAEPLAPLRPHVVLVTANLAALARNATNRPDRRDTHRVLNGYAQRMEATRDVKGSVLLRESHLDAFRVANRRDAAAVAAFRRRFFADRDTVRVRPKQAFDELVVVKSRAPQKAA